MNQNETTYEIDEPKLTKLEQFSALAMQGILANSELAPYTLCRDGDLRKNIAEAARLCAKELIKNLNGEL